jgi:hypothetical protein
VRFRYLACNNVDDKSSKGRNFAPELNSLIPVKSTKFVSGAQANLKNVCLLTKPKCKVERSQCH